VPCGARHNKKRLPSISAVHYPANHSGGQPWRPSYCPRWPPNPIRPREVQASPALEDASCGDELRPALLEPVRDADHRSGVIVHRVENHP
jgi:hypothetical protein